MTRQELVDKCLDKIQNIDELLEKNNPEFDFYDQEIKFEKVNTASDYLQYNTGDLFLAYFNALSKDDFEINKEVLSLFINIINHAENKELIMLHSELNKLLNNNRFKKLIESGEYDFEKSKTSITDKILLKVLKTKGFNIDNLTELYNILIVYSRERENIDKSLEFIYALRASEETDEEITKFIKEEYQDVNLKEKEFNKIHKKIAKDTQESKIIVNAINTIISYKNKLNGEKQKRNRNLSREKQNYERFLGQIDFAFKRDEIVDYEEIIKKIPDEEIRKEFLKMVYQHNLGKYKEIEGTYKALNENSYLKYVSLLKENDINKEEINFTKLMNHSHEWVSEILKVLKEMKLSKKATIKALEKSDTESIIYIKELKDKGVLSVDTLNNYPNVFSKDSKEIASLKRNLELFEKTNINPANLILNPEVLINNELLDININILESYNLINSIKPQSNYNYLADKNLINKIDMLLELGFEGILVDDLSILNENHIERLYALKSIGYQINSKEELIEVLKSDNFIIPDENLIDYIPNFSNYYQDENVIIDDNELEDYSYSDRTYNIDGVLLSKNRIIMNNKRGLSNFQSIITGSFLDVEEIEKIKSQFNVKTL